MKFFNLLVAPRFLALAVLAMASGTSGIANAIGAESPIQSLPVEEERERAEIFLQQLAPQALTSRGSTRSIPASFISIQTSTGLCSGFAIAPDRIATALHCVESPDDVVVISQSGESLRGQMIASAEDAAIVSISGANFVPAQLGIVPPSGANLTTWGHPYGVNTIESAQLSLSRVNGSILIARPVAGVVVGGFSGGQVVDRSGAVIGFNSQVNPRTGLVKIQSIEVIRAINGSSQIEQVDHQNSNPEASRDHYEDGIDYINLGRNIRQIYEVSYRTTWADGGRGFTDDRGDTYRITKQVANDGNVIYYLRVNAQSRIYRYNASQDATGYADIGSYSIESGHLKCQVVMLTADGQYLAFPQITDVETAEMYPALRALLAF